MSSARHGRRRYVTYLTHPTHQTYPTHLSHPTYLTSDAAGTGMRLVLKIVAMYVYTTGVR